MMRQHMLAVISVLYLLRADAFTGHSQGYWDKPAFAGFIDQPDIQETHFKKLGTTAVNTEFALSLIHI